MNDNPADCTLRLADGRRLGYAEFGDPQGRPVLYFHGFPGSRLEARLADGAARRQGVRLLAVDRPGYGLSDPLPARRLLDWPGDVAQFADALGLAHFGVLGVSGGGPFALTCAAMLPGRIQGFVLACPLGPLAEAACRPCQPRLIRATIRFGRSFPGLIRLLGRQLARLVGSRPALILKLLSLAAPAVDRQLLRQDEVRDVMLASGRQAFLQGRRGVACDMAIYAEVWGVDPAQISLPVTLWQGGKDRTIPPATAEWLAARLCSCRLRLLPDEGHFSLLLRHMDQILAGIV
ncbi:alpha/beta fold hydrolase [Trichloromonas sp.]|uniref:alpha/beta fold hydrolase n=1 Tax=Trichloromonas sp. TaxID=3069249 RepID=UPI003D81375A